jgi:hypothetical protein
LIAGSLVTRSLFDVPVSLASAALSVGAVVSLMASVRSTSRLAVLRLPAASEAVKSKRLLPSASATLLKLKAPLSSAVVLRPRNASSMAAPGSRLPDQRDDLGSGAQISEGAGIGWPDRARVGPGRARWCRA